MDIAPNQREKLERLCRYVSRPPAAIERLALTASGHVRYMLKTPYRDGTTHIVLEPLDLVARLAALVPPPRMHLTRYHRYVQPESTDAAPMLDVPVYRVDRWASPHRARPALRRRRSARRRPFPHVREKPTSQEAPLAVITFRLWASKFSKGRANRNVYILRTLRSVRGEKA